MKIVIFLQYFKADLRENRSGTQNAVLGLSRALARNGADVTVLAEGVPGTSIRLSDNYKVAYIRKLVSPFMDPLSFLEYVRSCSLDTVFVLNGLMHIGMTTAGFILRLLGRPYVVCPHNAIIPEFFSSRSPIKKALYLRLFERGHLRNALAVTVFREMEAVNLSALGVSTPTILSANGIETIPASLRRPEADELMSRPTAIFFGRVDIETKGLDLLLRAWGKLPKELRPYLTIQGPATAVARKEMLRLIESQGLQDDVRLKEADYITPPERILSEHDIFCLCSRWEAFSISGLQAMAAGCLIIVSKTTGISEHIANANCGVLIDPNEDSIRGGVAGLLEKRAAWPSMRISARRYVRDHLLWDEIARDWLQQLSSIRKQSIQPKNAIGMNS
ncbi:MAG TPA: glycosyltransferase [Candidatus Accumulibacter phosphatis]|nr:glycosyltransferase [Candidatus Accumulibacter phosphatis]